MILLGGFVIGAGGVEFVVEVAEVVCFFVAADGRLPFFGFFVPVDAFVGGSFV